MSSGVLLSEAPGGVFVVERLMVEAAAEDADEAVGECSECAVVGAALGAHTPARRDSSGPISSNTNLTA